MNTVPKKSLLLRLPKGPIVVSQESFQEVRTWMIENSAGEEHGNTGRDIQADRRMI